jgi:hypothetical protein
LFVFPAGAETILLEAEGFEDHGGWFLDQQSMDIMGSAYLLAHGLGVPVEDASTSFTVSDPGVYRLWVRTRDWVAEWGARGAPGRFRVLINGETVPVMFGTKDAEWAWQDGGEVTLTGPESTLSLHDLTGFEGRCDAVLLSNEPGFVPPNDPQAIAGLRRELSDWIGDTPVDRGHYDVVVVGGGLAGCCAAVSAARSGLSVALIQDRPVLGGNSSSEVRVWIGGQVHQPPYPVIGEIVSEMFTRPAVCPGPAEAYGDDLKLQVVSAEENIDLNLGLHVNVVEMDAGRIAAVVAQDVLDNSRHRFTASWFVDCTGDATVGYLAGADYEFTETGHLGTTNLWMVEDMGAPVAFPDCPWALDLRDKPFPTELNRLGKWFWESGFDIDTIEDAEAIRDHNLRAMYGAWNTLKNHRGMYPDHSLTWAAAIAGKRESRRLLGDVILTKDDVLSDRQFPDGCVASTWMIDLHYPDERYVEANPENPFLSVAKYDHFDPPYSVPYRCLYSRNIPNLAMAGRDISVTHEALGTVRVMATGGLMGEVLGRALYLCDKHECDFRDVYEAHLDEFKQLLTKPTGDTEPDRPSFIDEVGDNLAPAAEVTASGDYDTGRYPLSNINDGLAIVYDNNGRWLSAAGVPNWVEFRWDKPRTVAAARIVSGYYAGGAPGDPIIGFKLQSWNGQDWMDIPSQAVAGNDQVKREVVFHPVQTTAIRLVVSETPSGISRIWEVELYEALGEHGDTDYWALSKARPISIISP